MATPRPKATNPTSISMIHHGTAAGSSPPAGTSKTSRPGSTAMKPRPPLTPRTVDEYMAQVPAKFRPTLERLRKTIKAAAPDAEEVISYKMPAFRQNGMLVYFAAFEDHCSL